MKNQKIRTWVLILTLVWVTALLQGAKELVVSYDNQIMTAFASTGATIEESKLVITGEWTETLAKEEDIEKQLVFLAGRMGWKKELERKKLEIIKQESTDQIIWYVQWEQDGLTSVIQIINQTEEKKTYCSMEMVLMDQSKDIIQYKEKAEGVFKKYITKNYETTLNFYGEYKGKLSTEEQIQQIKTLFQNLHAKEVSEIQDAGIYSVYGYTSLIEDYMEVMGHRINLNAAFSYKEEEDVTCLSLATPILNESY